MKKSKYIIIGIILIIIIIYQSLFKYQKQDIQEIDINTNNIKITPVKVKIGYVQKGNLVKYITASGITEAIEYTKIKSMVSGMIEKLNIIEGKTVKKGDTLVVINNILQKANFNLAKNKLIKAQCQYITLLTEGIDTTKIEKIPPELEKNFKIAIKNFKKHLISQEEFDNIKREYELAVIKSGIKKKEILMQRSGLNQAEAEYKKAKFYYENCIIRAPYNGIIGNIKVHNAEFVTQGTYICTIVNLDKLKFKMKLMESDIGFVKKGDSVKVRFTAFPEKIFTGNLIGFEPVIDTISRTLTAIAIINNPEHILKSGMFGTTKIAVKTFENRLIVPRPAILIRDQRKLVFVVRNNTANWCYVKTGEENDDYIEITWSALGLKPGDIVITDGHFALAHESPVQIIE